jgi:hypothetical protein
MTGTKSFRENNTELKRGRKRFLERVQETKDAEQEIKEFTPVQLELDFGENDYTEKQELGI